MRLFSIIMLVLSTLTAHAQEGPDPNFYIYLCFGQSNMEGNATPEAVDNEFVDEHFQTLACTNFSSPARTMGQWYTAYPPIVRTGTGLGMADYFGRSMVAALPAGYRVGVVDVAIGGADIKAFFSEEVAAYAATAADWMKNYLAAYDNDPYKRLVDMAKIAQSAGVIKGILLHQGETNNGQQDWPQRVKTLYNRLLDDLGLNAEEVPLLVGEVVDAAAGGACSLHNTVIAKLPSVIPTSHIIYSTGCDCVQDKLHFTASSYRTMGKRYAIEALRLLGRPAVADAEYQLPNNLKKFFTATGLNPLPSISMRPGNSKKLTVRAAFSDGHKEDVTREVTCTASDALTIENGMITANEDTECDVEVTYTDFTGNPKTRTFHVSVSSDGAPNRMLVVNNGSAGTNIWDKQAICTLKSPMEKNKGYVVKARIKADNSGKCALWPIWSTSENRNQWGNSNDVQYLSEYTVGPTFNELTWDFTASFPHDKLQFVFGLIGGKVYIDDVSCVSKDTGEEMVANGTFDSDDLSNWEVLSWAGQSMTIEEEGTTGIRTATTLPKTGQYYDLSGRRVARPQKGVYIIDGKKVVF